MLRPYVNLRTDDWDEHLAAAEFAYNNSRQQWQTDISVAKQHLDAAQQRQARAADASRRHYEFRPGDRVLLSSQHLRTPGDQKPKLSARFHGPFKIIEMVSPVAARLEFPPSVKIHPVIHARVSAEAFHCILSFPAPESHHAPAA